MLNNVTKKVNWKSSTAKSQMFNQLVHKKSVLIILATRNS